LFPIHDFIAQSSIDEQFEHLQRSTTNLDHRKAAVTPVLGNEKAKTLFPIFRYQKRSCHDFIAQSSIDEHLQGSTTNLVHRNAAVTPVLGNEKARTLFPNRATKNGHVMILLLRLP